MRVFHHPIRVYYEDTDAGGAMYHANYLCFFERARSEMLRTLGVEQDQLVAEHNLVFVVKSAHLDYLKPARFNECLDVSSEISLLKKASLNFEQIISRQNVVLCKATIRIACVQLNTATPQKIPTFILQKLIHD